MSGKLSDPKHALPPEVSVRLHNKAGSHSLLQQAALLQHAFICCRSGQLPALIARFLQRVPGSR